MQQDLEWFQKFILKPFPAAGIREMIMGTAAGDRATELTCRDLLDLLSSYIDDELDQGDVRLVEVHLGICRSCVDYVLSYRETTALAMSMRVDHVTDVPVPEELLRLVLKRSRD